MERFRAGFWIALTLAGAIGIGCISEAPDLDAASGKPGDSVARPVGDPSPGDIGGDGTRGNGNGNDNGGGTCNPACPDFDGDGAVDISDLTILLGSFGLAPSNPCVDIDGDGLVDLGDLVALLATFGSTCNGNGNGNANDNGAPNGNDNGAPNGNDNGAPNGNDNGAPNGNDNGAPNGNDNGAPNGNDNGAPNGNDNGAPNGNDNGAPNGNDNGAPNGNGNDNGGGGLCPDGSTQVFAQMTGDDSNQAEYRDLVGGCRRFRVRVRSLQPFTTYTVAVNGVAVGSIQTDEDGRGELEYDSSSGNFPPGFPNIVPGDTVTVGPVSGTFGLDCSSNANCNG